MRSSGSDASVRAWRRAVFLSRAVALMRLSRLFPVKRHRQVRLDDGSDVARPHHRSVTAEVDDFTIATVEVTRSARVAPCPNS